MSEDEDVEMSGKVFRAVRKMKALTMEEMAVKTGMSFSNVRRVERAERTTIRRKSWRMLAELVEVPVTDLAAYLARFGAGRDAQNVSIQLSSSVYEKAANAAAAAKESVSEWIGSLIEMELDYKTESRPRIAAHPVTTHAKKKATDK